MTKKEGDGQGEAEREGEGEEGHALEEGKGEQDNSSSHVNTLAVIMTALQSHSAVCPRIGVHSRRTSATSPNPGRTGENLRTLQSQENSATQCSGQRATAGKEQAEFLEVNHVVAVLVLAWNA